MDKIKSVYKDYADVIEKIGDQRIEGRLKAIGDVYLDFLSGIALVDEKDVILNRRVLIHTILDYFADITRLKEFHNIDKVSKDKIIAYESSWLLRRKPIQVLTDSREDLVYINEKFVLTILVNHLTAGKIDKIASNTLLEQFCNFLLYYLKYRNCDAKILEMLILSFKAGNSINTIKY